MTRIADRNGFFFGSQTFRASADAFVDQNIIDSILDIMQSMHEITVTCKYMKEYYQNKTGGKTP